MSKVVILQAVEADAESISTIAIRALRETNIPDYAPEIIERIVANFTPPLVGARMADRLMLVATIGDEIIGTASLHEDTVRGMYVRPDWQGRGVGAALMDEVEKEAKAQGLAILAVPSSITAEGFYRIRGFVPVRNEFYGAERTIIMMKTLGL